ncbi:Apoptosis facilitator Bcl-2-like 14, partial [Struthio camelus australis]
MEEIPLEDDERDSIEYKILMAYAQRRLSVSEYGKLMKKEANVQKPSSLNGRAVKFEYQSPNEAGPSQTEVSQGAMLECLSQMQTRRKYLSKYCLPSSFSREKHEKIPKPSFLQKPFLAQNRLAKLVTSRPQPSPSDVSFKMLPCGPDLKLQGRGATGGSESEENDEEKIIQTIVALLRQSGDQLEEKIKKDKTFYQHFIDMLSYTFFKRVTDLILEDVSADSTSKTEGQIQCTKVAFTLEVATRLTAVDNHPMNMVLGFGIKYLREHFTPWIQNQGGW